mgnify:FL=1
MAEVYADLRRAPDPLAAWSGWCEGRDALFTHPSGVWAESAQSPATIPTWDHDPSWRLEVEVGPPVDDQPVGLPHSGDGVTMADPIGTVRIDRGGDVGTLTLYWLRQYGGGLFLPFRDATSGEQTYGGGRYLLDGAKSADLGGTDGRLVLDFNFAYHPSCVHDPRWSCPLAPPTNTLPFAVRAGERLAG